MTFEVAKKILVNAADLGVPAIKLNWKGESTFNPIFPKVTELAWQLASGSTFMDRLTNSNFKFRTDQDAIFDGLCYQTKVKVSYDSFIKSVFETQRAGGDHELTTRNIDKFYNYPKRKNTKLVIQAVRTNLNKNEDIAGQAKRRWPEATISIRDMVAGRIDKDLEKLENMIRDASGRQSCLQAHVRVIFNHQGKAFVCCPDVKEELNIGDINKSSLSFIFNSARAIELRSSLKNKSAFIKYNACKNCSSFESYANFAPKWDS